MNKTEILNRNLIEMKKENYAKNNNYWNFSLVFPIRVFARKSGIKPNRKKYGKNINIRIKDYDLQS